MRLSKLLVRAAVTSTILATIACASSGGNVMGADGRLEASIAVPLQMSTARATQRVINAAVAAGYQVESTSPGVITLAPITLATGDSKWTLVQSPKQRVMLRANIAGGDDSSSVVVSGTFTDEALSKPNDPPLVIGHWVGGRLGNVWSALAKFADAIRTAQ